MGATGIELGVNQALPRVLDRLRETGRAWAVGSVGSGKTTLAQLLVEELDGRGVFVQLADRDEPDAAIDGFYLAARHLKDSVARARCWRDWASFTDALGELEGHASAGGLCLILDVPRSWEDQGVDEWSFESGRRCQNFLRAVSKSNVPTVWITSRTMPPDLLGDGFAGEKPIALPQAANSTALRKSVDWGSYQVAADALVDALDEEFDPSPILLRLGIGVVALGGDASVVARVLAEPVSDALRRLTEDLAAALGRPEMEQCRKALARLLLVRRPIQREQAIDISAVPEEHRPLLTDCVAYGADTIRVSASVRGSLRNRAGLRLHNEDLNEAHLKWRDYYRALDGKPLIGETVGDATEAWLEKTHHGLVSEADTDVSHLPCRELYWTRGRYLSKVRRKYDAAASVYAACAKRFENDSYAHHYWAYNLERAGLERDTAEAQYREAIRLEPTHPWWNSRLVTFLVGQGRQRAARTAWAAALSNVDPDGDRTQQDPWLAEHLHNWVARAWLEAGAVGDALAIFRSIPEQVINGSTRLSLLHHRVLDAAEADAIGETVYPSDVPIARRWVAPRFLPQIVVTATLKQWYPGRIVSVGDESVRIVYAQRLPNAVYQVQVSDLSVHEWREELGLGDPRSADGYLELGLYSDGLRRVALVPAAADLDAGDGHEQQHVGTDLTLAYLDRWNSPTFPS